MAVYMPTWVGNEANYRTGDDMPEIQLGITLKAAQYTFESDSFDEQYDKDAEKELKWLRKGNNLRLCEWREKNAISKATNKDIIFKGLHEFGVSMYEPYYYINGIAYTHGDKISIVG